VKSFILITCSGQHRFALITWSNSLAVILPLLIIASNWSKLNCHEETENCSHPERLQVCYIGSWSPLWQFEPARVKFKLS